MKAINIAIHTIETSYWYNQGSHVCLTAVDYHSTPAVSKRCRIGFDRIDLFMSNYKINKRAYNLDWHLETEDYFTLPENVKANIWIRSLYASYLFTFLKVEDSFVLEVRQNLLEAANQCTKKKETSQVLALVNYAIKLGSGEALLFFSTAKLLNDLEDPEDIAQVLSNVMDIA